MNPTDDSAASADLLRELVENLPDLAWAARADGHIDYYNRRWYEYTGTTVEQMQGWGWQSVHAPDMVERVTERWKASLSSGEPFEMEFPLRRADGTFRWFLTRVRPLKNQSGTIVRWFGTNTDVDEQRRLLAAVSDGERKLQEENELTSALLRLGDAFSRELDDQKLLQLVTDEATRLTGAQFGAFFFIVDREQGESLMLYTLSGVPKAAFDKFPTPRATPLFAPTFRGEATIRLDDVRKDPRFGKWGPQPKGHLPVVSYLATPVITVEGKVLGGLFFGHGDAGRFTAQHERLVSGIAKQAALGLQNARLYRSLREEQEKVKQAYEMARTADRRKDEFLAMLGHELRNPLAPILTALQLMTLRGDDKTQKERAVIERQVRHLVRLVDDLLDVSRITGGKIQLNRERLDLSSVLSRALELASPLLEQRRHQLTRRAPAVPVIVHGDAVRLAQIFSNLLTNAARYTDPGGKIEVETRVDGDRATVIVADNGQGIPREILPRLFDLFVQGDRTSERARGSRDPRHRSAGHGRLRAGGENPFGAAAAHRSAGGAHGLRTGFGQGARADGGLRRALREARRALRASALRRVDRRLIAHEAGDHVAEQVLFFSEVGDDGEVSFVRRLVDVDRAAALLQGLRERPAVLAQHFGIAVRPRDQKPGRHAFVKVRRRGDLEPVFA